jgi:hypothetical protein
LGNTPVIFPLFEKRKESRVFEIMKILLLISLSPLISGSGLKLQECKTNLCETQGTRNVSSNVPKLSVSNKGKVAE